MSRDRRAAHVVRPPSIPEAVRRLAVHPLLELPVAPGMERFEQEGVAMVVTRHPGAQIVEPVDLVPAGVEAAATAMRAIARAHGKSILGWWITPEHDRLAPRLEALGLRNRDGGGYESLYHAMATVTPPATPGGADVEVRQVETFEEFAGAARVAMEAFAMPARVRDELESGLLDRFEETRDPRTPSREFVALVEGRIVGSASLTVADAGVGLFGGCVLPELRGRGVYRALLRARWDFAVERGTPALTVQAGRLSMPTLERLGFVHLAGARVFIDALP